MSLVNNITTRGWSVAPLMVLVAGAKATTHIPSRKNLETTLKLLVMKIKTHIQTIQHNCHIICTFNTSPILKVKELATYHKPTIHVITKFKNVQPAITFPPQSDVMTPEHSP